MNPSNPELERERGEFEKWAKTDGFPDADLTACGCQKKEPFHYQDAYTDFAHRAWQARAGLSSQQSTLRRVRAVAEKVIAGYNAPLLEAAEKGFGDTALYWSNKKAGAIILLAAIEREFGGVEKL